MAESTILKNIETEEQAAQCRYFKLKVLESHQADSINTMV